MALVSINHHSYYLGMDMPITVLLPEKRGSEPADRSNQKYPVLYLLHGHADDNTAWIRKSDIELLAREQELIVVMPSGHRGFYSNGKCGHLYFDYIAKELPVVIGNFFHASSKREDNYIAGLSMGGYGALKIGLSCPEQYAAIGVMSAAVNPFEAFRLSGKMFTVPDFMTNTSWIFGSEEEFLQSDNNLYHLIDRIDQMSVTPPRIYHSCGKQDPLYSLNCELKEALMDHKNVLDYQYNELEGHHNWAFWNPELKKLMEFMKLI